MLNIVATRSFCTCASNKTKLLKLKKGKGKGKTVDQMCKMELLSICNYDSRFSLNLLTGLGQTQAIRDLHYYTSLFDCA